MMDYMSDFPPPSPKERKNNLLNDFKKSKIIKNEDITLFNKYTNNSFDYLVDNMSNNITGINGNHNKYYIEPGSYSGYVIFTKKSIFEKLNNILFSEISKIKLLNSKDKLQLSMIVYNNKDTKKKNILSYDVIENILKKL